MIFILNIHVNRLAQGEEDFGLIPDKDRTRAEMTEKCRGIFR